MALASYGTYLNGALVNPGSLNQWLNANGGYADSDLIVWACMLYFNSIKDENINYHIFSCECIWNFNFR